MTTRIAAMVLILSTLALPAQAFAGTTCGDKNHGGTKVSIDLGCKGKGNAILDATFGVIKFLTSGVGIVLVGSLIYAGIMYTTSRGDPNATAQAINRIRANVVALLLFAFAYAMINYLVPGQLLK